MGRDDLKHSEPGERRDPFIWNIRDCMRGTDDLILLTPPLSQRNEVMFIEGVTVAHHGETGPDIDIGVYDGNRYIWTRTVVNCAPGVYYRKARGHTMLTDHQLVARFRYEQGVLVAGDLCEFTVVGYILESYTTP